MEETHVKAYGKYPSKQLKAIRWFFNHNKVKPIVVAVKSEGNVRRDPIIQLSLDTVNQQIRYVRKEGGRKEYFMPGLQEPDRPITLDQVEIWETRTSCAQYGG